MWQTWLLLWSHTTLQWLHSHSRRMRRKSDGFGFFCPLATHIIAVWTAQFSSIPFTPEKIGFLPLPFAVLNWTHIQLFSKPLQSECSCRIWSDLCRWRKTFIVILHQKKPGRKSRHKQWPKNDKIMKEVCVSQAHHNPNRLLFRSCTRCSTKAVAVVLYWAPKYQLHPLTSKRNKIWCPDIYK